MGLSQQIGASSLIKPGVIDSSAARPASPYEGQVIFQKDTDQLLVWNGTAWVIPNSPAQNPQGLELITTCTVTSTGGTGATASGGVVTIGTLNTSVIVSNAFSSTYDNYKIIVSGGVASQNCDLNLIMGSTTSGYAYSLVYVNIVNGNVNGESSTTATKFPYFGGGSTNGLYGIGEILAPNLAKFTGMSSFYNQQSTVGATGTMHAFLANTTQYTAFTMQPHSGGITLTGGTIRVYGYRNS